MGRPHGSCTSNYTAFPALMINDLAAQEVQEFAVTSILIHRRFKIARFLGLQSCVFNGVRSHAKNCVALSLERVLVNTVFDWM